MAHTRQRLGSAVAGIATLSLVLTSSKPTIANQPAPVVPTLRAPAQRPGATPSRVWSRTRSHYLVAPGSCSVDYGIPSQFFVGIPSVNLAGGFTAAVLGGINNQACDQTSAIGAGAQNVIASHEIVGSSFIGAGALNAVTNADDSFVGAGESNEAAASLAFVGAGAYGTAEAPGSFVGAGGYEYSQENNPVAGYGNTANGIDSFIGAGDNNMVSAQGAFVGSGLNNAIVPAASFAVIGGGEHNGVLGTASVVGGGAYNTARGTEATIPGGYENAADGNGSFAAGTLAKARHIGAFVWNDNSTATELQSTANYQFLARASGGFYLYSNSAANVGVELAPNSGTWASLSDRTMKSNIVPLDDAAVLAKVAALPISEWSYKAEGGVRHVGPMAQDFYSAFKVGEDDRHITSIDEDGVALAAIKALNADNASLHSENTALRNRLTALEQKVEALASERR